MSLNNQFFLSITKGSDGSFGSVVVDRQAALLGIPLKFVPIARQIAVSAIGHDPSCLWVALFVLRRICAVHAPSNLDVQRSG